MAKLDMVRARLRFSRGCLVSPAVRKILTAGGGLAAVTVLFLRLGSVALASDGSGAPSVQEEPRIAGLAVPFIRNRGQTDERVAFYAQTFAGTAFVTRKGELVLALPAASRESAASRSASLGLPGDRRVAWTLSEAPVSDAALDPHGEGRSPTGVSVFRGRDPGRWQSDVEGYRQINLGEPWPGIEYRVAAHGKTVERIFTVAAGADASRIKMRLRGAQSLRLDQGRLIAATGNGPVIFSRPVAFQSVGGKRKPVEVAYALSGRDYGFRLGAYDPSLPVVIDPLIQSTYLGGSGIDEAADLVVAPGGEVYVTGSASSSDFPGVAGGPQTSFGGVSDVFVALLSADLTSITQATYLGGSDWDAPQAMALGPQGQVYVVGLTSSADFPATQGSFQSGKRGNSDAFVALLRSDLKVLTSATYLGGPGLGMSGGDQAWAVTTGSSGTVYVAGTTASSAFPGTVGGAQASLAGGQDAFVARFSADLNTLVQATYLGGSADDQATTIAVSATRQVYVGGVTLATDFPGTVGGYQSSYGGGPRDGFIALLSEDLTALSRATYFGGADDDFVSSLSVVPSTGKVYAGGLTSSPSLALTAGSAQPNLAGGTDGFVAEFQGNLIFLTRATYLGGSSGENLHRMTLAPSGNIYVAGETASTDFPGTAGGAQPVMAGLADAFVSELGGDLKSIVQSSYLGASGMDRAFALGLGSSSEVYLAGLTFSTDFPMTAGGAQESSAGNKEAFVARMTLAGATTTSTTTTTTLASSVCGDANDDGRITATDALIALQTAVGLVSCPPTRCDADDSGVISPSDALRILRTAVGLPVTLNCPVGP